MCSFAMSILSQRSSIDPKAPRARWSRMTWQAFVRDIVFQILANVLLTVTALYGEVTLTLALGYLFFYAIYVLVVLYLDRMKKAGMRPSFMPVSTPPHLPKCHVVVLDFKCQPQLQCIPCAAPARVDPFSSSSCSRTSPSLLILWPRLRFRVRVLGGTGAVGRHVGPLVHAERHRRVRPTGRMALIRMNLFKSIESMSTSSRHPPCHGRVLCVCPQHTTLG